MEIKECLTSLGKTSGEVAENLRKQGIKGLRSTRHNPIVKAIYKAVPDFPRGLKTVFGHGYCGFEDHWTIDAVLRQSRLEIRACVLPQPVQDFIGQFMKGQWWDLDSDNDDDGQAILASEDRGEDNGLETESS